MDADAKVMMVFVAFAVTLGAVSGIADLKATSVLCWPCYSFIFPIEWFRKYYISKRLLLKSGLGT